MTHKPRQLRAKYARTNGDFLVNTPDGFPSGQEPIVWWYGSDSQFIQPLSRNSALSAVTRATSLIVNTLTSLPWRLLQGGLSPRQSQVELPPPRWLTDPMLLRPDDRFAPSPAPAAIRLPKGQFWSQWIRSALWHGMGYLIFEEDFAGQPIAGTMRILNPDVVGSQTFDGMIHRRIGSETSGAYVDTGFDGRFTLGSRPYRLIELSNPTAQADEYGVTPGVLDIHAAEIGMGSQALSYSRSMFRSGVPSGYLKVNIPNFGKPMADQLRQQWVGYHGGDERSVAVLNSTTDFVPLTFNPVNMDLINARKMSLLDIANAFGIPPYFLGADVGTSNTYSNAESRNRDLQQSLIHWASAAEDVLTALFPQNNWVEVDFRGLLRPDVKTRYESYSMAIKDGWMTIAEVRSIENLPPLPEQGYPAANPAIEAPQEVPNADA